MIKHTPPIARVIRPTATGILRIATTYLYDKAEYATYNEALAQYNEDAGVRELLTILFAEFTRIELGQRSAYPHESPRAMCRRVYRHLVEVAALAAKEEIEPRKERVHEPLYVGCETVLGLDMDFVHQCALHKEEIEKMLEEYYGHDE